MELALLGGGSIDYVGAIFPKCGDHMASSPQCFPLHSKYFQVSCRYMLRTSGISFHIALNMLLLDLFDLRSHLLCNECSQNYLS